MRSSGMGSVWLWGALGALAALGILRSPLARAEEPEVQIGSPAYQGSGCPEGSVSATLSPDATALSLIFDRYTVEAGRAASGVQQDRKQCSLQIPMTIPRG